MSSVAGPHRGLSSFCLALGVACLLLVDLYFAPAAIALSSEAPQAAEPASPFDAAPALPARTVIPAAARVPTIVARFGVESKAPVDETAIRSLATAMIEDHEVRVVLEGHSDTYGADDYNHDLSLERASLVKARLVELGVSAERIETVGLGATHPLRSDLPDAQSVNRRVEVKFLGR